jgi:hypothetical protein
VENKGLMTSEDGRTVPPETPGAARYIALLAEELAQIAKRHDLEALAHILEMARLEAEQISRRGDGPAPEGGRPDGSS